MTPTQKQLSALRGLFDAGLCYGKGNGSVGHMCVQQALNAVFRGDPHSDGDAECVSAAVTSFQRRLNDGPWSHFTNAKAAAATAAAATAADTAAAAARWAAARWAAAAAAAAAADTAAAARWAAAAADTAARNEVLCRAASIALRALREQIPAEA